MWGPPTGVWREPHVSLLRLMAGSKRTNALYTTESAWERDDRVSIRHWSRRTAADSPSATCESQVGTESECWAGCLVSHAGSHADMELQVRLFFRRVFLNHSASKAEKAFWLNLILKPFPLVHQARILFMLYGPMCAGLLRFSLLLICHWEPNWMDTKCRLLKLTTFYS